MKITQMKTNGVVRPIGFCMDPVQVSWKVEETDSKKAIEETVEVSTAPDFSDLVCRIENGNIDRTGTILPISLSPKTRYF